MRTLIKWTGIVFSVFPVLAVLSSLVLPMKTPPQWWMTVIGTFVGSVALTGVSYVKMPNFSNWFAKKVVPMDTKSDVDVTPEVEPEQKAMERKDLECLYHLSERVRVFGDQKSLDLCRSLQDRLFMLHHGMKEEVNEKVDTPISPTA